MTGEPLDDLRFDTPNNACLSLRIIAEKIGTGDLEIILGQFEETSWGAGRVVRKLEVSVSALMPQAGRQASDNSGSPLPERQRRKPKP